MILIGIPQQIVLLQNVPGILDPESYALYIEKVCSLLTEKQTVILKGPGDHKKKKDSAMDRAAYIGPSRVHAPASQQCGLYSRHYFLSLSLSPSGLSAQNPRGEGLE